ncbi:type I-E CRISPR-associated protein Cse1/CasA [Streptomyces sp. NBC_01262]|uniref:type I-E CRISPR-associated protein Cse1/CasA n=1 Tax=Streptomyces sp. NBC_01262 TaxID=2903803 RepID=UPI002E3775BA|nr:type I-E CRISPR-associated protein Cse1/CasA [Streptomyces sp. NBC_01262]
MRPAPARFSAADDPWIDVRRDTTYQQVGLRALFLQAHTFDDLALSIAPAASALLRIATAITAHITDLDDPELTADEWNARRCDLLAQPGFDADTVNAYFDAHCFEVFHPVRPWLQDPLLANQCPGTSGINRLIFGRPAGNNLAWLSPHHDTKPVPVPTGQALQHLLIHHYYGASGTTTPRTVGNRKPHTKGTSGPLRSTVSFHPLGRTLHETLLASVPKLIGEQSESDRRPWEEPGPPDPLTPPRPMTWPGRILTGRSRHALLLVPGPDGSQVSDVYLTWACEHRPLQVTDPYLVIHTNTSRKPELRRFPRRADADRAWWRELDALLLAPDEHHAFRRPEIFDTLNDLPPEVRASMRVRVHGFDQDGKVNNRRWYTAITPPILTWAQEHDPQRAQRIGECVAAAEHYAVRLTFLAGQAWKDTTNGPGDGTLTASGGARPGTSASSPWTAPARTAYWKLAEETFWRLVENLDIPARRAFADAAQEALRTATENDRIRYRHAARAIATAVAALHRPPRLRQEESR